MSLVVRIISTNDGQEYDRADFETSNRQLQNSLADWNRYHIRERHRIPQPDKKPM